jgi:hypothetical protein
MICTARRRASCRYVEVESSRTPSLDALSLQKSLVKAFKDNDLVEFLTFRFVNCHNRNAQMGPCGCDELIFNERCIEKSTVVTTLRPPDLGYLSAFSSGSHLAVVQAAGYTPVIVNAVEHVNKIDDEIISQIRNARFLVADFTGHRGGVYFEAGFALGLGLPVFWTCKKDHLDHLHFDVRQVQLH